MLHAKFQDQRTSGSGEEDFLNCDLDHLLYKLSFSLPQALFTKFGVDWPSGFRRNV